MSTLTFHYVSLNDFLSKYQPSSKEDVLIAQERVFKYIDNWVERHRPLHLDDYISQVEDVSLDQLENYAHVQSKYNEVKDVIKNEWLTRKVDIHHYDPDCEYESHVNAMTCLMKCYLLDDVTMTTVDSSSTSIDLKSLYDEWKYHLSVKDVECMRYLVYGRALMRDYMDTTHGMYSYLYIEECASLLTAILDVKHKYDMSLLEEPVHCADCAEYLSYTECAMEEEEYMEPKERSHKRKRGNSDPLGQKKRRTRNVFEKLSPMAEDALQHLMNCLSKTVQQNTDIFMYSM